MMKDQFNSASKQKQVKEELSNLAYHSHLSKSDDDKRKLSKISKIILRNVFHYVLNTGDMKPTRLVFFVTHFCPKTGLNIFSLELPLQLPGVIYALN